MANESISSRLKAKAAEVSGTSPLTIGRTKMSTEQVCSYSELTLREFDWIKYVDKSTGETVEYPVLIFDEAEDGFYCGGMALSDLCKAIQDDAELRDGLKQEGLKMTFSSTRTKNGNNYVNFTIL